MKYTNEQIKKLEAAGFSRWTKGSMDRLYINPTQLGLEREWKNGMYRKYYLNGDMVTITSGRELETHKIWIDLTDGTLHEINSNRHDDDYFTAAAEEKIEKALA